MSEKNQTVIKERGTHKSTVARQAQRSFDKPLPLDSVDPLTYLQRTVGNQAVQELFRSDEIQAHPMQPGSGVATIQRKVEVTQEMWNERFEIVIKAYKLALASPDIKTRKWALDQAIKETNRHLLGSESSSFRPPENYLAAAAGEPVITLDPITIIAAPTIWIPVEDGGQMELPITDPRAQEYVKQRIQKHTESKTAQAPQPAPSKKNPPPVRLMKAIDKEFIRAEIASEPIPTGIERAIPTNPSDAGHNGMVIEAVNFFLKYSEGKNLAERLADARAACTLMREENARNTQSLILRDAERYLWARTGKQQFKEEMPAWFVDAFAPAASDVWNAIKFFPIIFNSIFGTTWAQTNEKLPHSAEGGGFWFDLGLADWEANDKDNLSRDIRPKYLNVIIPDETLEP